MNMNLPIDIGTRVERDSCIKLLRNRKNINMQMGAELPILTIFLYK